MGTELTLDVGTLYAFLLVLARVSGIFIFVPLPGIKAGPEAARAVLSVSLTLALASRWPVIDASQVNIMLLTGWILAEAAMGIAVGLAVAFLAEGFQMGAQIISLQAGYTFATTIDPTSGADSAVLLTIAQLLPGSSSSPPDWIVRFSWPSPRVFPPKCRAISRSRHPWSTG